MSSFRTIKQVVKENPAIVIGAVNAAALTALSIVVRRNILDTRLALSNSNTALKVILKEIEI